MVDRSDLGLMFIKNVAEGRSPAFLQPATQLTHLLAIGMH